MEAKEALEKAIKDVRKEWEWILLEGKFINKLKHADEEGDVKHIKRFERRAARYEWRINQSEQRVIEILNFLRQTFPTWNNYLFKVERETKIFNENILKRVSRVSGTIPKLIKEKNFVQIGTEVDFVMEQGVLPLDALLGNLEKQLKKAYEKYIVTEETQLDRHTENVLNRQPFLVIFHSVSERDLVDKIFSLRNLPTSFLGRRLEYAIETDYFWIEVNGKIHGFFGHGAIITPGKKKLLLSMRYGTYKGFFQKKILDKLYRKGILLPRLLLPKVRQSGMKLMIEIKGGKGSMANALDELVRVIKENGLENQILFLGFSEKPLIYLKQRLPSALTAKISFTCPKSPYIDIFDGQSFMPDKMIIRNIKKAEENRKFFIGGGLKKQKKFYLLIRHGARGALIWHSPETILEWLAHPSYAEATAKRESTAFRPF